MSCEYFEELISAEQDGELNEQEREELSLHLAGCEACRQFAESVNSLHKLSESDKPYLLSKERQRIIIEKTVGTISFLSRVRSIIFGLNKEPRRLAWLGSLTAVIIIVVLTIHLMTDKGQLKKTDESGSVNKLVISDRDIIAYNALKKVVLTEESITESKKIVFTEDYK